MSDANSSSPSEEQPSAGPVGSGDYLVEQGDCVSSIAYEAGLLWETIWNHPANSELKTKRKDPNVLLPGDKMFIPELKPRQEPRATGATHVFQMKGVPVKLRVRLLKNNKPRANIKYLLDVDGVVKQGETDGDGWVEAKIAPDASHGKLTLPDTQEEYPLLLGHLDPIDSISGVQARLRNLGYYGGPADDQMSEKLVVALKAFQKKNELKETGQVDASTQSALKSAHGS